MVRHLSGLLLLILLSVLAACSTMPSDEFMPTQRAEHQVTEQAALDGLNAFLQSIDEGQTRSSSPRRVATISSVTYADIAPATRSVATPVAGELLYIANFENGAGYAILAADDRLEPVIAIIDEGNLSQSEFAKAVREPSDGIPPALSLIASYATRSISDWNPPTPTNPINYSIYGMWQTEDQIKPIVLTKWGQRTPFNYYTPRRNCYAGCVAVAYAQYLTAVFYSRYKYRTDLSTIPYIGGEKIEWDRIFYTIKNNYKFEEDKIDDASVAVAHLIHMCGREVQMDYGTIGVDKGSYASSRWIYNKLLEHGFLHPKQSGYNTEAVVYQLQNFKVPVLISGRSYSKQGEDGHEWIVDGLLQRSRTVKTYTNGVLTRDGIDRVLYLHANFGWTGSHDGYYHAGVFDFRKSPDYLEPGDLGGSTDMYYYSLNGIIFVDAWSY